MKNRTSLRGALLAAMVLAAPVAWHAPLHAEDAAAAQPVVDPYGDLYNAMDEASGTDQAFNRIYRDTLRVALEELQRDPGIAQIENRNPGFLEDIGLAMRPWIRTHMERIGRSYRPRFMDLLREAFSPEDAAKMARFYRTDYGRRYLLGLQQVPQSASSGQPNAFLKPAAGHNPDDAGIGPGALPPPDAIAEAFLADPGLQEREAAYFASLAPLSEEIATIEPDKDVKDGLVKAIAAAVATYAATAYSDPSG